MTATEKKFTFEDLKKIRRITLPSSVPLELFRAVRLIGMYQGLPLNGKGTTTVVGKTIGKSFPVSDIDGLFRLFKELNVGIPSIVRQDQHSMRVAVDDCFCAGLPVQEGKYVCDLEGAIMQGALENILNRTVRVKEVKCNVNGDEHCEYDVAF